MRRFEFQLAGLETLLAYREDQAKLRASHAIAERQRAADLLGHLHDLVDAAHRARRQRRAGGVVAPHDEPLYEAYFARMARALEQQQGQVGRAAEHEAASREALRHAATKHRTVALLRERQFAGYRREAGRELTRTLDEVGARVCGNRVAAHAKPQIPNDRQVSSTKLQLLNRPVPTPSQVPEPEV